MSPAFKELERLSRVAPLGIRFRDPASNAFVGGGLQVSAYPPSQPDLRRPARVNPLSVYVLQDLPGLRAQERGVGDAAYWAGVTRKPFVVEVQDAEGRFQPFTFNVDLPFQGLFGWGTGPLASEAGVPLFSAPARRADSALAVLRAELWDKTANAPAAWALLDVTATAPSGQPTSRAMADRDGKVALFFRYPPPLDFASAPKSDFPLGPPLLQQQWTLDVRARCSKRAPGAQAPDAPDLAFALAQPAAPVFSTTTASAASLSATLRFGRELFVSTTDAPLKKLWIAPTA